MALISSLGSPREPYVDGQAGGHVNGQADGPPDRLGYPLTEPPLNDARDEPELVKKASELRAVTVGLEPQSVPDLVQLGGAKGRRLWVNGPVSVLGVDSVFDIALPAPWPEWAGLVGKALRAIPCTGKGWGQSSPGALPGTGSVALPAIGAVALGALPYDPEAPAHLTVPRLLVVKSPYGAWATMVLPDEEPALGLTGPDAVHSELRQMLEARSRGEMPDGFELRAAIPHGAWKRLVRQAVEEISIGSLEKVVLARRVDVLANRPFPLPEVLARLRALYPSCALFHVEGFLGASPETLVRRRGLEVLSHPLAGTVARSGDEATDAALLDGLMASAKDRKEHQLVVDAIAAKLRPLCNSLDVPAQPSVLALRNVSHLATLVRGSLEQGGGPRRDIPSALELAALLQPTPAVGGHPVKAALQWQRENEGFARGCYAGPVGWVDSHGDGEWALGLRSATVDGARASLYAGNGIIAGSDPDDELAETQLKLQALLAALVRP